MKESSLDKERRKTGIIVLAIFIALLLALLLYIGITGDKELDKYGPDTQGLLPLTLK